jgi:hypothetical protein
VKPILSPHFARSAGLGLREILVLAFAYAAFADGPDTRERGDAMRRHGPAKPFQPWTQRLRVEDESGVFALVPVSADDGQLEHERSFSAMWYPQTTGELFVFDRVCEETQDVVQAIQALARDLNVDPLSIASANDALHRAFVAADDPKGDASWRTATALGLGRIMGFEAVAQDPITAPLYCPPGSMCEALVPPPPEPPRIPRDPRDLEAVPKNLITADSLLRAVRSQLELACNCGGGGGNPPVCGCPSCCLIRPGSRSPIPPLMGRLTNNLPCALLPTRSRIIC